MKYIQNHDNELEDRKILRDSLEKISKLNFSSIVYLDNTESDVYYDYKTPNIMIINNIWPEVVISSDVKLKSDPYFYIEGLKFYKILKLLDPRLYLEKFEQLNIQLDKGNEYKITFSISTLIPDLPIDFLEYLEEHHYTGNTIILLSSNNTKHLISLSVANLPPFTDEKIYVYFRYS